MRTSEAIRGHSHSTHICTSMVICNLEKTIETKDMIICHAWVPLVGRVDNYWLEIVCVYGPNFEFPFVLFLSLFFLAMNSLCMRMHSSIVENCYLRNCQPHERQWNETQTRMNYTIEEMEWNRKRVSEWWIEWEFHWKLDHEACAHYFTHSQWFS